MQDAAAARPEHARPLALHFIAVMRELLGLAPWRALFAEAAPSDDEAEDADVESGPAPALHGDARTAGDGHAR